MKAGAAYVPLDPSYPGERLRYMIADAGVTTVVGDREQVAERGLDTVAVLSPHGDAEAELPIPAPESTGDEPAYVIYTSWLHRQPEGLRRRPPPGPRPARGPRCRCST
ncbi:Non-ribosomal peptide synthetase OS=Streptomyces alboniger OX=132473 GN=CP975_33790 PE=4 SV=1 [Streptomyces alboniger]